VTVAQAVATNTYSPLTDADVTQRHHDAFVGRWGFYWRAADLDAVHARNAGSGLLWYVRYGAPALPFAQYDNRPCMHWKSYEEMEVYRRRADHLAKIVVEVAARSLLPACMIALGCGEGLFTHLVAKSGVKVISVDPQLIAIRQAVDKVHHQPRSVYPRSVPLFQVGQGESLVFDDDSVAVVMMLDVIEH